MPRDSRGFYGIGEEKMRSSTTILNILEKEGLHPWIAWTTAKQIRDNILIPIIKGEMSPTQLAEMDMDLAMKTATSAHRKVRDDAGDMGSLIHKVIEEYYKAKSDIAILDNYTKTIPELTAPILAFLAWEKTYRIVMINSEETVYHEGHKYAGTLDLHCRMYLPDAEDPWEKDVVVDFKSSTGIYDEHILQLASYVFAKEEMDEDLELDGGMIVRLDKVTGLPEEYYYTREELLIPFDMFLAAKGYCDARDKWRGQKKQSKKDKKDKK